MSFDVPILIIIYNRPDLTLRVLQSLSAIEPSKIYVAADGPSLFKSGDLERCRKARSLFSRETGENITWQCEIFTHYQDRNLGCRAGVTAALDWFFHHEEAGIILEDDIVAHPSFFPFCEELLERYRYDERIGVIAANNHQRLPPRDGSSYRFSIFSHCWGWATWRRAWRCNDPELKGWPTFRDGEWLYQLGGRPLARRWEPWLDQLFAGRIDTWDMVWQFSCWQQGFLTVIPAVEFVENIGFCVDATHTLDERSPLGKPRALDFPLRHPLVFQPDRFRDQDTYRRLFKHRRFAEWSRKFRKALRLLGWRS